MIGSDREVVLLDIDNCISNDGWRIPLIDWKDPDPFRRYHDYHLLAPWDAVGNTDLFAGDEAIILFTSRPVFYRRATIEWLQRAAVPFEHLVMRNNNDHRPSLQVKQSQIGWLASYGVSLSQVVRAFDDRPEICEMYRSLGIEAHVRSLHDVCAYRNPITGVNHVNGRG